MAENKCSYLFQSLYKDNRNFSLSMQKLLIVVLFWMASVKADIGVIGHFFCYFSYLWGLASDLLGKKKVLLVAIICLSMSTLAFGFSINMYLAVTFRFLQGLSGGKFSSLLSSSEYRLEEGDEIWKTCVNYIYDGNLFFIGTL